MDIKLLCLESVVVFLCLSILQSTSSQYADDANFDDDDDSPSSSGARCPWIRYKLKNGRVKIRSRGRIAKFVCEPGFELVGKRFATCVRGQWNNPIPVCVSRGCNKPNDVANARVMKMYRGAVITYDCVPGYTLDGASSIYCDGRRWSAQPPVCEVASEDPPLTCDFEDPYLCGWSQDPTHDFDWKRNQFTTPSGHVGTGPSFDHTFGQGKGGFYLYLEASLPHKQGDVTRLFSPVYHPDNSGGCFTFWYHMFGETTGGMKLYLKPESQVFGELPPSWAAYGDHGNMWLRAEVAIRNLTENFQIIIEGIRGSNYIGDSAIDDVALETVDCESVKNSTDNAVPESQVDSCRGRCRESYNASFCGCSDDCIAEGSCCHDFTIICTKSTETEGGNTEETGNVNNPVTAMKTLSTPSSLEDGLMDTTFVTTQLPYYTSTEFPKPIASTVTPTTSLNKNTFTTITTSSPTTTRFPNSTTTTTVTTAATTSTTAAATTSTTSAATTTKTSVAATTTTTKATTSTTTEAKTSMSTDSSILQSTKVSLTLTPTEPSGIPHTEKISILPQITTEKPSQASTSPTSVNSMISIASVIPTNPMISPSHTTADVHVSPVTSGTGTEASTRKTYNLRPRNRTTASLVDTSPVITSSIPTTVEASPSTTKISSTINTFTPYFATTRSNSYSTKNYQDRKSTIVPLTSVTTLGHQLAEKTSTKLQTSTRLINYRFITTPRNIYTTVAPRNIFTTIFPRNTFTSQRTTSHRLSSTSVTSPTISVSNHHHTTKTSSVTSGDTPVATIVTLVLMLVVCVSAGVVFFCKRRQRIRQSKSSDDAEMRFLSEIEVEEYNEFLDSDRNRVH